MAKGDMSTIQRQLPSMFDFGKVVLPDYDFPVGGFIIFHLNIRPNILPVALPAARLPTRFPTFPFWMAFRSLDSFNRL